MIMKRWMVLPAILLLAACGGGGGDSSETPTPSMTNIGSGAATGSTTGGTGTTSGGTAAGSGGSGQADDPVSVPGSDDGTMATASVAARFLTQSTFGPSPAGVNEAMAMTPDDWLLAEFDKEASYYLPLIEASPLPYGTGSLMFWPNAITSPDQLRQRMVYALSQIIVVSDFGGEVLTDVPVAMGYYQDVLVDHAFGNYRDLLEAITYTPAMGHYLTYLGNEKGDPETGRVPDENYAREIMQLFTIGVVELNMDGSLRLDGEGNPIETYDNTDITGLARVFTGLDFAAEAWDEEEDTFRDEPWTQPMAAYPAAHSTLEKTFLGLTIPAGTGPEESIELALDHIFAHPNVPPFVSRQLIQRFVTSHPQPDYIERVATVFADGVFTLGDGTVVGEGRRGDLRATLAAVLLDEDARSADTLADETFGKIREPAIRLTNWARAFGVANAAPEYVEQLQWAGEAEALGQKPFASQSVFNFYRPGYVAPGTLTGERSLTVPELQIVNATSIVGYANFMLFFIAEEVAAEEHREETRAQFEEDELPFDESVAATSFLPDYATEYDLASNVSAFVDHLDQRLTYGAMTADTRAQIVSAIDAIPLDNEGDFDGRAARVHIGIWMVMTSPDFLVQR